MTSTPSTIDIDTELSAVNAILGSIGQSPVASLDYTNPEISFIYNILTECNQDVQSEGWMFNIEYHIKLKIANTCHIILLYIHSDYTYTD